MVSHPIHTNLHVQLRRLILIRKYNYAIKNNKIINIKNNINIMGGCRHRHKKKKKNNNNYYIKCKQVKCHEMIPNSNTYYHFI